MEVFKSGTGILPVKNVPFPTKYRKESRARCPCHAISQPPEPGVPLPVSAPTWAEATWPTPATGGDSGDRFGVQRFGAIFSGGFAPQNGASPPATALDPVGVQRTDNLQSGLRLRVLSSPQFLKSHWSFLPSFGWWLWPGTAGNPHHRPGLPTCFACCVQQV
jgi:hypothetical protein